MAPFSHIIKNPSGAKSSTKRARRSLKPLKPLNGFIGFRKYYAPIFMGLPGFQQKDASGFLTLMWSHEISQSTWTILAKAWSLVRDFQGKENSPLDVFIDINAGLLDIVAPADYLLVSGFAIVFNADGLPALVHVAESSHPQVEISIRSVEGILENSINAGYVDANIMAKFDHNVLIVAPAVDNRKLINPNQASNEGTDHSVDAVEIGSAASTIWNGDVAPVLEYATQVGDAQMDDFTFNSVYNFDFDLGQADDDAFPGFSLPPSSIQPLLSPDAGLELTYIPGDSTAMYDDSLVNQWSPSKPALEASSFDIGDDFWVINDVGYQEV